MFGLRPDGKKIKNVDPIMKILPHIMKERADGQNMSKYEVDCEKLDAFIAKELEKGISYNYMHIVIASILRVVALRPRLNRFVMNGRLFKRKYISVSFVVKKSLRDDVPETTIKLKFTGKETIKDVKDMMDEVIKKNTSVKSVNGTDKLAKVLTIVPNFLIKFLVWFIKWLDKHGMLPGKIIDLSPFHTTFFVTNLKSIKTDYIYHHIYNFGNTGTFFSMGKEHMEAVVNNDGEIVAKKIMKLGIVMDERFCDGFYFANSLRYLKRIIDNLDVLNQPLENIVEDVK